MSNITKMLVICMLACMMLMVNGWSFQEIFSTEIFNNIIGGSSKSTEAEESASHNGSTDYMISFTEKYDSKNPAQGLPRVARLARYRTTWRRECSKTLLFTTLGIENAPEFSDLRRNSQKYSGLLKNTLEFSKMLRNSQKCY